MGRAKPNLHRKGSPSYIHLLRPQTLPQQAEKPHTKQMPNAARNKSVSRGAYSLEITHRQTAGNRSCQEKAGELRYIASDPGASQETNTL